MNALLMCLVLPLAVCASPDGDRLAYLDDPANPYYVGLQTARLATPQWVGEEGVEAVIVLAIDDMTDPAKYERFLRPILDRLKRIDGRAPVSIMTKYVDPTSPQLQAWGREGLHLEAHTYDHPCPLLQGGDIARHKATFDRCLDLLAELPGGRPVAFRMPCCDSMNSVSPRFFTEIFHQTTPGGRFLTIDTSVFQLFTPNDPDLARRLVLDTDGREKFRKYLPSDRVMANYIEDYPYPYVIGHVTWEFPSLMPSDWDAQHLNGKCSPVTVGDMKAAIDATVAKQGVFSLCFHPHGWIDNQQVVELIDYAVGQHGAKVKFLNFREVEQRLNENLLIGNPLRDSQGRDNGVRLLDVNGDGCMDVVIGRSDVRQTRVWNPRTGQWASTEFPLTLAPRDADGAAADAGVRFGVFAADGGASVLIRNDSVAGLWRFENGRWREQPNGLRGLELDGPVLTARAGRDRGVRLRDLNRDGACELIVSNPDQQGVFLLSGGSWRRAPFHPPAGVTIVDGSGRDAGLRFADLDEDGRDDMVFSNAERYSAHVFRDMQSGWSRTLLAGRPGDAHALPLIVRADGGDNGSWFKHQHMWVQNEDTGGAMPDHVDSRGYVEDFLSADRQPTDAGSF